MPRNVYFLGYRVLAAAVFVAGAALVSPSSNAAGASTSLEEEPTVTPAGLAVSDYRTGLTEQYGPEGALDRFSGVVVDAAGTRTVYVPEQQRSDADQRLGGRPGIRLETGSYSQGDMRRAAGRFLAARTHLKSLGINYVGTAAEPDGSGVTLLTDSKVTPSPAQLRAATDLARPVNAGIRVIDTPVPTYGMMHDVAPNYYGGSVLNRDANPYPGGWCASAWPVQRTASLGDHYLMTAWHCYRTYNTRVRNGDYSQVIGYTRDGTANRETRLIEVGSVGNRIYLAASTDRVVNPNYYSTQVGDTLCTTKATILNSTCGGRYTQLLFNFCYPEAGFCVDVIEQAHRANGLPLSIRGDSGGPVYLYYGGNVTAVGIISGASYNLDDPSHNPSELYYVPAWWNFPYYGVRIYRP